MQVKKAMAVAISVALMLASASAYAGDTKIKVILKDQKGVTINGKVTAKLGSSVKSCKTAGGTCTLKKLKPGKWTVSAKTANGAASGGPKAVTARKGKKVTVTIVLKKK